MKNKPVSTIEAAENLQLAFKDVGISIKKEFIPIISKLHDCFFKFKNNKK